MKKNLVLFILGIICEVLAISIPNVSILLRAALALSGTILVVYSLRYKMKRMVKKADLVDFVAE